MSSKGDIAVVGLAVMGQNLILNMADHGFSVVAYNRTPEKVTTFLEKHQTNYPHLLAAKTIVDMVEQLKRPRKILLMIKAGVAVDHFIDQLTPYLEPGDIIIDGGNAHPDDTTRRTHELKNKQIHFVGAGISGGEEGARHGPSIMPGGDKTAWSSIQPIFQTIAAKTPDNTPCCQWVGPDGAGHFVKMVHNGIEYGDMQIIAEAYDFMKSLLKLNNTTMSEVFEQWRQTELDSYLIDITAAILRHRSDNGATIDDILDCAGQKGTGRWTCIEALNYATPLTLISESVFARQMSAQKDLRTEAEWLYNQHEYPALAPIDQHLNHLKNALLFAKIISYTQGFMLLKQAATDHQWDLDYGAIAQLWRAGCIIRSQLLDPITNAFEQQPTLDTLLFSPYFKSQLENNIHSIRHIVSQGVLNGLPMPAMSSALSFFDSMTRQRLPANLLQAQRDFFGAHQYERIDEPRGTFFHTDWIGSNMQVCSGDYNQ